MRTAALWKVRAGCGEGSHIGGWPAELGADGTSWCRQRAAHHLHEHVGLSPAHSHPVSSSNLHKWLQGVVAMHGGPTASVCACMNRCSQSLRSAVRLHVRCSGNNQVECYGATSAQAAATGHDSVQVWITWTATVAHRKYTTRRSVTLSQYRSSGAAPGVQLPGLKVSIIK